MLTPSLPPNTKNILAADVEIKGTLKFKNDLTIDGKIEGEIMSTGALTVGKNAEIRGDIKTRNVTVFGHVEGTIIVEGRCELRAQAVLHGDLKALRLVMEDGATFIGKSEVTPAPVTSRAEIEKPPVGVSAPETRTSP